MKKLSLFLMLIMACFSASAQDVIVKKDGSTVLCKIIQVNGNEVIYLKWSDLQGPQYIMDSSLVSNINFQDGRQEKLNDQTSNNYAPGIQQTGESQYNDNSLIKIDLARNNNIYTNKAKKLQIIGWSVGCSLFAIGGVCLGLSAFRMEYSEFFISGMVISTAGIATTTGCLIKAHQLKKKADSLFCIPFLQRDINIGNGATLSAGVDIIHNFQTHHILPGLGLQFNF